MKFPKRKGKKVDEASGEDPSIEEAGADAEQDLAEAQELRREAEGLSQEFQKQTGDNHWADTVRRALGSP